MRRKSMFTKARKSLLNKGLTDYLTGVLARSECSARTARDEALRVFGREWMPVNACRRWLQGVPIAVDFYNSDILARMLQCIGDCSCEGLGLTALTEYIESHYVEDIERLVGWYWLRLALILDGLGRE